MPTEMSPEEREQSRSRGRIRYVDPENCGKITARDCYWTRQFLARYVDRCETVSRKIPRDGHALARPLPVLVDRIPVRPGDIRHFDSEKEKAAHKVLAYAVQGSACSRADEPEEADLAFKRAAEGLPAAVWAGAELKLRYGSHLARIGDPSADRHLVESFDFWARAGDETGRARTHFARATLLGLPVPDCILEIARAIRIADGRSRKGRRVRDRAIEVLARKDLVFAAGLANQEEAVFLVKTVQDDFKGRSMDSRKARLLWIEGVLVGNLAVSRHAERRLRKARRSFRELRAPVDFVLVSLDLARFLFAEGDAQAARNVGVETLDDLVDLEDSGSAVANRLAGLAQGWPDAQGSSDLTSLRREIVGELGSAS